jgi:hypothetical protein
MVGVEGKEEKQLKNIKINILQNKSNIFIIYLSKSNF